jgi:tellurite resistance protein TerC
VLGALVLRSVFILVGAALIARFEWILYIFGVILIVSGWKMFSKTEPEVHPERNVVIRFMKKVFPVTTDYDSPRFILRQHGKTFITPLLIVLITVETTDVVFAVDSIPAVFGVTRDPFIVYSSNVFAILGLRAFYFLLAGVMNTFYYLSHGISLVLIFIGAKMLLEPFSVHISILPSLLIVTGVLTISIVASLIRARRERRRKDAAAG